MALFWRVEEGDARPGASVPAQGPLLSTGLVSSLLSEVLSARGQRPGLYWGHMAWECDDFTWQSPPCISRLRQGEGLGSGMTFWAVLTWPYKFMPVLIIDPLLPFLHPKLL